LYLELRKLSKERQGQQQQQQAIFGVGGMACAFCASTIEEGLSQVKGIDSVKVIMNTSEVVVRYDPNKIDQNSVKKHLMGLGYYAFEESEKLGADERVVEDNARRTLAAAAITAPIAIIAYLSSMLNLFDFGISFRLVEMVSSGVVLFYFGLPIHIGAFNGLKRGILNEHVLYGAAGFAAYAVGLISLFYPSAVDFFNAASLLTTFHLAAGWYGAKVRNDTTKALRKILNLQPPTARVIREQKEEIVMIEEVRAGDLVKIKGGEKIPVDGIIESGESTVSEAILTGESEPIRKRKGDSVLAGSTNGDGLLLVRTERVGTETMLMRVAGNVKQIQESKPLLLTIFDKVIDRYVMAVLALALSTAVGWAIYNLMTGANMWFMTVYASLAVLVIGYPCAIGLSTPPVKLRAISIGADKGVLINDASALFLITRADTIVLDKTGTITEGKPKVNAVVTFNGVSEQELLGHAASIEQGSSHPIARAIVDEAGARELMLLGPSDIRQVTGKGAMGSLDDGRRVVVGNQAFLEEHGISITKEQMYSIRTIDSPVFVAVDKKLEGVLGVSDIIRLGIDSTINRLKQAGFDIIMLTGDTKVAAEKVASRLGIRFEARMSPMQKAEYIKRLQSEEKRTVIAVGDGVNDAPALAQSDAGMAIGSGIDISKETASFVLLTDDIAVIPALVRLGRKFSSAVKRNIILALSFNAAGIPIAAMGYLNPFVAMTIMIVDVAVVFASTWLMTAGGGGRENIVIERKELVKPSKKGVAPSIITKEERAY
jgi:heavy metal translocating P-type ATPase